MPLKIIGRVLCPLSDGHPHTVAAGISLNGEGGAIHIICAPCSYNLQAKRSSSLGQRLAKEALGEPTALVAVDDAPGTDEDEPEPAEVAEAEPEREAAPQQVAARPPDGDPYLAGLP